MNNKIKLGVFALIVRDGRFLLGRRSAVDHFCPGKWCHPGGGVEYGEPLSDALVRECLEEVGLRVEVGQYLKVHEYITPHRHVVLVFMDASADGEATALDGFSEVGWFSQSQIQDMCVRNELTPLTPLAVICFAEARELPWS